MAFYFQKPRLNRSHPEIISEDEVEQNDSGRLSLNKSTKWKRLTKNTIKELVAKCALEPQHIRYFYDIEKISKSELRKGCIDSIFYPDGREDENGNEQEEVVTKQTIRDFMLTVSKYGTLVFDMRDFQKCTDLCKEIKL